MVEVNELTEYDRDFYKWTQETAELICRGEFDRIQREHLAEEIADMGKRDKREVRSRMTVLMMHLLKWRAQPELCEQSSWRATIVEQRRQLELVFRDSPSLYRVAGEELRAAYGDAVEDAMAETRLAAETFPGECPYSLDELLKMDLSSLE
ncbi:MAG TPA: DUF29 domain-containing protein [Bryobacteraceae bacterium]|jgi:hypothetical protein|nr:DUF29 domain-containing protein [Bryobacteraceae bacterium]